MILMALWAAHRLAGLLVALVVMLTTRMHIARRERELRDRERLAASQAGVNRHWARELAMAKPENRKIVAMCAALGGADLSPEQLSPLVLPGYEHLRGRSTPYQIYDDQSRPMLSQRFPNDDER